MNTLRWLRNSWIPCVTTIVLGSFSNAFAQQSYKITDLGNNKNKNNFAMVMGLNNQGWAENMDGVVNAPENSTGTTIASGRAVIGIYGFNIDLGTLGKHDGNSWNNYGGINDRGEAVGYSETADPDPNGEDICGFHTHLTCVPFLWRDGHMRALPTLGGNNGQASAINNRGEVVGFAENGAVDSTCPADAGIINNRIALPALWKRGNVEPLPLVDHDVDGLANGINYRGQAVGYSGTCTTARAVVWKDDNVYPLKVEGYSSAYAINNRGQIVGFDGNYATVWQHGADGGVTNLRLLPGDSSAFATGINNRGQVVGSDFIFKDSNNYWSHGFIWQDGVTTDLNTLIPADSNLFIIAASNINERGQISGMATVQAGPHKGEIHAYLLTPVDGCIGASMADFARTNSHFILPANAGYHNSQKLGPSRLMR
jgi:probable HAF family extracellular repeat protein